MCRADQQHSPTHFPALPDAWSNNTTLHKANKKKKQEQMLTNSDSGWIKQVKKDSFSSILMMNYSKITTET